MFIFQEFEEEISARMRRQAPCNCPPGEKGESGRMGKFGQRLNDTMLIHVFCLYTIDHVNVYKLSHILLINKFNNFIFYSNFMYLCCLFVLCKRTF